MPLKRLAVAVSTLGALALFSAAPAAAWFDRILTRDTGIVPACESPWALQTIASRFGYKEWRYWYSDARIDLFGPVREIAYRPWGPEYTPRRYCEAKVYVADTFQVDKYKYKRKAKPTTVYYSIIEKGGFAGIGWGVEWCVVGYDYNFAYAPNCRAARP